MSKFQIAIFVYAILLIGGGLYAYMDAHHMMSLMGGLTLGILEIFFGTYSKSNRKIGMMGASGTALLGVLAFAGAAVSQMHKDKSPAISISMAVVSLLLVVFLLGGHFAAQKSNTNA